MQKIHSTKRTIDFVLQQAKQFRDNHTILNQNSAQRKSDEKHFFFRKPVEHLKDKYATLTQTFFIKACF